MHLIGFVIHTIGELLVALTVLRVHGRVMHDKKVDRPVLKEMRFEQRLGIAGAILIFIGFLFQLSVLV
jgi:hypothetical protein